MNIPDAVRSVQFPVISRERVKALWTMPAYIHGMANQVTTPNHTVALCGFNFHPSLASAINKAKECIFIKQITKKKNTNLLYDHTKAFYINSTIFEKKLCFMQI